MSVEDIGPGAGIAAGGGSLVALLRVQDLDTAISQLRHRRTVLPERLELNAVTTQSDVLAGQSAEIGATRDEVVARLTDLQKQVDSLDARRTALETRMYSSRGVAPRDLQAMDEEVRHLRTRRTEIEDEELEAMEEQEPLDGRLADIGGERARLQSEAERLRELLAQVEAVIDGEIGAMVGERAGLAAHIPPELAAQYEQLRARLGGIGAARLVANRCEGCHLELPSVEIDRIRHLPPDTMVTCEHCGRILVRGGGPSASGTPSPSPG